MLENIKMLCNIADNSKDNIIQFYINEVSNMVKDYCHIDDMTLEENNALQSFIQFKIAEIIGGNLTFTPSSGGEIKSNGTVKSITRGDTSITYATGAEIEQSSSSGYSSSLMFSSKEKSILNRHRVLEFD